MLIPSKGSLKEITLPSISHVMRPIVLGGNIRNINHSHFTFDTALIRLSAPFGVLGDGLKPCTHVKFKCIFSDENGKSRGAEAAPERRIRNIQ